MALETLATREVATRAIAGPFHLAVAFAADPAEVVLIDIERLSQEVFELIEVLRETSAEVGIVIISTAAQRDIAGSALCKGADILLTKPVSCAEAIEAVERAGRRRVLAEAERDKGIHPEMLAKIAMGVAHEVNNPLTTISGWLQVLIADRADDEKLVEMLKSINEEADRIADIVRQLLVLAQQAPPRRDEMNVGKILKEIAHGVAVTSRDKEINLETSISAALPLVRGDAAQIRQACETIVGEAQAALDGAGEIRISCQPKARGVQITFQDNGPTMSEDALASLFDPFEFGRNADGRGIGMCLSREIIRSHGGRISVESSDAAGTRFTIWLPAEKRSVGDNG